MISSIIITRDSLAGWFAARRLIIFWRRKELDWMTAKFVIFPRRETARRSSFSWSDERRDRQA